MAMDSVVLLWARNLPCFYRRPLLKALAMKRHFQYWGVLYILATLFLGSFAGQYFFQVVLERETINHFLAAVFENWQSEWIQLFVQALLIQALGHVLYKREAEDQERMERKLDELLKRAKPT
jgi:hypothetical protein